MSKTYRPKIIDTSKQYFTKLERLNATVELEIRAQNYSRALAEALEECSKREGDWKIISI